MVAQSVDACFGLLGCLSEGVILSGAGQSLVVGLSGFLVVGPSPDQPENYKLRMTHSFWVGIW